MTTYSNWDQRQLDIASGEELDRIERRRAAAVQKEIDKDKPIGEREANAIHRLLKGRAS